jgi:hypothetical protein
VDLLRWQFGVVHALLDTSAAPARYAEAVVIEDITISCLLSRRQPLAVSTFRGRTGLSHLPPLGRRHPRAAWSDSLAINVAELRTYAHAVHAATDTYLRGRASERLTLGVLTALLLTLSPQRFCHESPRDEPV